MEELVRASHETDQGNFILISEEKARLAERVLNFIQGGFTGALFSPGRGEAFDAACKMARGSTGRSGLVSVEGAWHGLTGFAMSLSSNDDKGQFGNLIPETRMVAHGDLGAAEAAIDRNTAAFFVEPIQTENHCREAQVDYVRGLRELCDRAGALLVLDETQSGFGRTGAKFAVDRYGVHPDVMIFGEAVSSGVFPMAGSVFTGAIKKFFDEHPLIHLHTFGGHDVGCRVSYKALEIYSGLKPWENASRIGEKLRNGLERIANKAPAVVESISGRGLLLSVKFGSGDAANKFCRTIRRHGMIARPGLVDKACVPIRPALILSDEEADLIIGCVEQAVKEMESA
jgi:acetylornithine/succinyldiaminopimelate/putrescine aminotransferase